MRDRVEKLLLRCSEGEKTELNVLLKAYDECVNKLEVEHTKACVDNFEAAKRSLLSCITTLEEVYFNADPSFPTRKDALDHLQSLGYVIKKTKFYSDAKKKLLRIQADGSVRQSDLQNYIITAELERETSDDGDTSDEMKEKTRLANDHRQIKIDRERFLFEKDQGLHILRSDAETEFAIKIGAFEAGFKNTIRLKAEDVVFAVGGDVKKAHLFVEMMNGYVDELLDDFGKLDELKITIKKNPQITKINAD